MNKKLLLLSNAYWPSIGGIENSLRHLAQEAVAAGDDVEIVVSDLGLEQPLTQCRVDSVDQINVTRYPMRPFQHRLLRVLNLFWSNYLLYRLLRAKKCQSPDTIVIARFHFAALIASIAGFSRVRYLVPSVFSQQVGHENQKVSWKNKLKTLLHSYIQRQALIRSAVFVFSETMHKQCAELVGTGHNMGYSLVKPGVDTSRFFPVKDNERDKIKQTLGLSLNKPIVLFVGRFVKAKGVELLIKARAEMSKSCHLVLVGSGEEEQQYKQLIQQLGLNSDVTLVPPLREVENYYRAADAFVMCSNYEPLGQTILEAFASGLTIAAFKKSDQVNTATQELAMDDYIFYAEEYSDTELARAIDKQIAQFSDLDRQIISQQATMRFSWKKLYSDLVNE